MRQRRAPRPSFVVTLATAALAAACGAKVEGSPGDAGADTDANEGCPSTMPTSGSACEGRATCNYDVGASCPASVSCEDGRWQRTDPPCNPPPPFECPASEPTPGTSCFGVGTCSYPDRCTGAPGAVSYQCTSGTWLKFATGPLAACPIVAPTDGTSCCPDRDTTLCEYDWCGSFATTLARCDPTTNRWSVSVGSCNPPPPDVDAGTDLDGGADEPTPSW